MIGLRYAELVYNGRWFTPLREALDAFVQSTERNLTGAVRTKLYKGNVILAGRKSPHSLYREDYVTFDEDDVYNQADAEGFIRLYGLPLKVEAMLKVQGPGVSDYESTDFTEFKRD
jgi:argininosuccinate synthase